MKIHLLGYVLIPLAFLFFFYSPRRLYAITVFSIPFTGAAVFQISTTSFAIEGIRPSLFLGILCLVRHFFSSLYTGKIIIQNRLKASLTALFIFAATCSLSLMMPFLINGNLLVLDSYSSLVTYAEPKPLYFNLQYVTQLAYLLFGCLMAYYIAVTNKDEATLSRSVKIYLNASLFVCLWGLLEVILFYLGISYPAFLFNSNAFSMNAAGTLVLNGRPRITSVSLEPSVMSQQLLTALPFAFWLFMEKSGYFKRHALRLVLLLIICTLTLSLSTTAVFGLAAFTSLVLLFYIRQPKLNIYLLCVLAITFIGILVASPFLIQGLLQKLSTYSGEERLKAITFGWNYFREYPWLGIGWGVFPSWDLVVCILAGAGVAALTFFALLIIQILIKFKQLKLRGKRTVLIKAAEFSLIMLLLVSQFSGFIYHCQYFWLILGLAMSASSIDSDLKRHESTLDREALN